MTMRMLLPWLTLSVGVGFANLRPFSAGAAPRPALSGGKLEPGSAPSGDPISGWIDDFLSMRRRAAPQRRVEEAVAPVSLPEVEAMLVTVPQRRQEADEDDEEVASFLRRTVRRQEAEDYIESKEPTEDDLEERLADDGADSLEFADSSDDVSGEDEEEVSVETEELEFDPEWDEVEEAQRRRTSSSSSAGFFGSNKIPADGADDPQSYSEKIKWNYGTWQYEKVRDDSGKRKYKGIQLKQPKMDKLKFLVFRGGVDAWDRRDPWGGAEVWNQKATPSQAAASVVCEDIWTGKNEEARKAECEKAGCSWEPAINAGQCYAIDPKGSKKCFELDNEKACTKAKCGWRTQSDIPFNNCYRESHPFTKEKNAQGTNVRTSKFNPKRPTKVYFHGFKQDAKIPMGYLQVGEMVVNAYHEAFANGSDQKKFNLIIVDASQITGWGNGRLDNDEAAMVLRYSEKAYATQDVAYWTAKLMKWLDDGGKPNPNRKYLRRTKSPIPGKKGETTNVVDIHCIGHSLGGQTCGRFGRTTKALLGMPIKRITALDAAGPLFHGPHNAKPEELEGSALGPLALKKTDANYVELLHTNSRPGYKMLTWGTMHLGTHRISGHADFYLNGGDEQPGCGGFDSGSCSHFWSWKIMREFVNADFAFEAYRCKTEADCVCVKKDKAKCFGAAGLKNYNGKPQDVETAPSAMWSEHSSMMAEGLFYVPTSSRQVVKKVTGVKTGKVGVNIDQPMVEVVHLRGGLPSSNNVLWETRTESLNACLGLCRHDILIRKPGKEPCGAVVYQRETQGMWKDKKTGQKSLRKYQSKCIGVASVSEIRTDVGKRKEAKRLVFTTLDKHPKHVKDACNDPLGGEGVCCGHANGPRRFKCKEGYRKTIVQVPGSSRSRCTEAEPGFPMSDALRKTEVKFWYMCTKDESVDPYALINKPVKADNDGVAQIMPYDQLRTGCRATIYPENLTEQLELWQTYKEGTVKNVPAMEFTGKGENPAFHKMTSQKKLTPAAMIRAIRVHGGSNCEVVVHTIDKKTMKFGYKARGHLLKEKVAAKHLEVRDKRKKKTRRRLSRQALAL